MNYPEIIFLSLGSNLGERKKNILAALDRLSGKGINLKTVSSFYETESVGDISHPAYINIVCRATTSLSPYALLDQCQEVERNLGRKRKGDRSPRCIDIDILFYGEKQISTSCLTAPHPELHKRNFVLVPLKEICPEFINPVTGEHIDEMIEKCTDKSWVSQLDEE